MHSNSRILLAIPARGGSKRLLRKNVLPVGGKPMIAHTIEAARASGLSSEVYVCTEDAEIAQISERFGAKVFPISTTMADDLVSSTTPCLMLAETLVRAGHEIEWLFNLQPSSPLRNASDIREAHAKILSSQADYLVSATPIDPHYFHWALNAKVKGADNAWQMYFGKEFLKERPLLPVVQRPNGAIKLARYSVLKTNANFFGDSLTILEMPEERSIHVATYFDYLCAEAMIHSRRT